jgi:porin
MKFIVLLSVLLFWLSPDVAAGAGDEQSETDSATAEQITENAINPEDDSQVKADSVAHKSGYSDKPNFGSSSTIPAQLEEDDRVKEPVIRFAAVDRGLKPWFEKKKKLNEMLGFKLGIDYNTTYQSTNDSLTDEDRFWSGIARVYGTWDLVNKGQKNKGSLVWSLEHRHNLHYPLAPSDLPGAIGYIGVTSTNFSDAGSILGYLYWKQNFADGNGGVVFGRFDPNDYMDVLGYFNPYTTFSNLAVGTNESIALPDFSWGIGAGRWLTDQVYLSASISDANGTATNNEFFEGGAEFFSQAEIGWSPSKAERYFTNIHLTVWHVDEREDLGIESSKGFAIGANKTWNDTWMAFARAGWSEGSAPISNEAYTIGFGRVFRHWNDVIGIGINWGNPPQEQLPRQTTGELFYRMQFSGQWQFTPSIQYIKNPALNTEEDSAWVFGLRMRLTL